MKKFLLPYFFFLIFACSAYGADRYWVGGTGKWSESSHWSELSGGQAGASIPTADDNVIFDANSFSEDYQFVSIDQDAYCHSFSSDKIQYKAAISSGEEVHWYVSGSFILSPGTIFGFRGDIHFNGMGGQIISPGHAIFADIYFESSKGKWEITGDLNSYASVTLSEGALTLNCDKFSCNYFSASGLKERNLFLGNAKIEIRKGWDCTQTDNLKFDAGGSEINFTTIEASENYRAGNLKYNTVNLLGNCVPDGTPCAAFTITLTATNVICNGQNNGTATATIVGGAPPYSYTWIPTGQTTATATGLGPGTYICQVTDNNGNTCFCSIAVTEPPALLAIPFGVTSPPCNGMCTGTATVSQIGGVAPYTYSWWNNGQTTQTATGLCVGVYTVTVTDANGCSPPAATTTMIVTQPTAISPNGSSTNVTCFGFCDGTATVNPSGGTPSYTYLWNTGATTNSISGLCPATYTCTITDFNGCTVQFVVTITQPAFPLSATTSVTNNPLLCNGDCNATITANPSGGTPGYTYNWTPGNLTTQTITGLCAGTYTCVITDANGCTVQVTRTITQPALLTIAMSSTNNPLACFGNCNATATATVGGGTSPYSYSWSTTPSQSTVTATGLCAGTWTVFVTDANGCTLNQSITITQPTQLTNTISTTNNPVACNGNCNASATANPAGGTPSYTYSWAPGAATTQTISNLCVGTYTVYVTDANGCQTNTTVTITQPPPINPNITTTNNPLLCNGDCNATATSTPSGGTPGYSYVWNPGAQTTQTATGLCAGTYTLTITDAAGCTRTQTVTITQPSAVTLTLAAIPATLACNGDCNATLSATVGGGVAPYTYLWSPGSQTTASISGQCAGTYTVTVTDANGCTRTQTITVLQPTALTLTTAANPATCSNTCNGSASAIGGGDSALYLFLGSGRNDHDRGK